MGKLYSFAFVVMLVTTARGVVAQCCGDCNGNGQVTVDELVTAANHALDGCTAGAPCSRFPATGQTTSSVTGDDGSVEAGAPLRYVDNADGTITDLNTGLMWEKKIELDGVVNGADLHDADNCYPWAGSCQTGGAACGTNVDCGANGPCNAVDCQSSPLAGGTTIFQWVAALNVESAGAGFAGHTDWRVPNVRELQSIADYGASSPAVSTAFNGANCGPSCTDLTNPACSCTYWVGPYRSSTTYAGLPDYALNVDFLVGSAGIYPKSVSAAVRAVRGGL